MFYRTNVRYVPQDILDLLDEKDELCGWVCPHCNSQFDLYDIVTNIYGEMKVEGEA